jgi:hypothetical protein
MTLQNDDIIEIRKLSGTRKPRKYPERYWTGLLIKVSLRNVVHIGLVIGLRSDVLAFGCASGQYSRAHLYLSLI